MEDENGCIDMQVAYCLQVAQQIYAAVVGRKDEVFVGPAYKAILGLFRSTGLNPFSVAR